MRLVQGIVWVFFFLTYNLIVLIFGGNSLFMVFFFIKIIDIFVNFGYFNDYFCFNYR